VDEPQRLIREALVAAISAAPGLSAIAGSASDPTVCERADAAVLAAGSLRLGGQGLLRGTPGRGAPAPIVIVADHGPVTPSVDAQGLMVVSYDTPLATIVESLRAGGPPYRGAEANGRGPESTGADHGLTTRERQVLSLLASGLSPAEVARGLDITTNTVRDHIKAIRQKLDRPTIMGAVLEAIRRGMLSVDPN
jgi:DNA-binding CsgD family transcriptional regulator